MITPALSAVYLLFEGVECDCDTWDSVRGVFSSAEEAMRSPLVRIPPSFRRERYGWRKLKDGSWAVRRLDTKDERYGPRSNNWTVQEWPIESTPEQPTV